MKSKQGEFLTELRAARSAKPAQKKPFTWAKDVNPAAPEQKVKTEFNRQKGLKAPSPDQLPVKLEGQVDMQAVKAAAVAAKNTPKGKR